MIWKELESQLAGLADSHLLRTRKTLETGCSTHVSVDGKPLLAFCSNDYLGLASHPAIQEAVCKAVRQWGTGSGGSHVVNGHMTPHQMLEEALARFVGADRALYYSTGYMANIGVVPTLVGRGDAVFADRLNHASLIDAVQLSRADHRRYAHKDMAQLEKMLAASDAKRKLILSDAVFSMDGDVALLKELLDLAEQYDAWLVLDDAHGFGVLGQEGRGSLDHFGIPFHPRLVYIGTLGKAAGVSGAFVAGTSTVIEWLMQRSRSYIFTTASSPVIAAALLASLELVRQGEDLRGQLRQLAQSLHEGLQGTAWRILPSFTAIHPIIVGENDAVLKVSEALMDRGIWVPAIRPPTVPKGQARLRISLSASHTLADVGRLVSALREIQ
ncbi:MAG: 8-amino-7-oxononanoate synthase [Oxalobacter sp.]|nr:8-amino-7-oxononanoate synthase [Oxalobacter sp.]